ncbi:MAG: hypothetical protein QHH18_03905 [Candidatus Bathyarchaeota archaeon]|jgi:hypothetical protein|nr:hypothetical protein [Candidatus Bathyarchaeota archaeon A05DMB-5]MDH7557736.1 hypothetical protein [Candidatus Bathyarchaeota archaeon]
MKKKMVLITVELVDESLVENNETIIQELFEWFKEDAVSIPWAKKVKKITVKDP